MALSDAAITRGNVQGWYQNLKLPWFTPPNWLFGPVWTVLYIMIGIAAWRVWRLVMRGPALRLWGWQLLANAAWTPAFFGLHRPGLALWVMVILLVLVARTLRRFLWLDALSGWLMVPYLAWTGFAAVLNAAVVWLNR